MKWCYKTGRNADILALTVTGGIHPEICNQFIVSNIGGLMVCMRLKQMDYGSNRIFKNCDQPMRRFILVYIRHKKNLLL